MAKLTASTFIANGSLSFYINNELTMSNNSSASVDLEDHGEYIVHWYVMGSPGSSYSVTISSPREAQFQLTRVIGSSGKDLSSIRFSI
jgi:hypothetical protein